MFRVNLRNAVERYLSVPVFEDKWEKDQEIGAGYFYALTYASILSFFKEHQPLCQAEIWEISVINSSRAGGWLGVWGRGVILLIVTSSSSD